MERQHFRNTHLLTVKTDENSLGIPCVGRFITDICRSPFEGIGKPEPLKENLSGFWSRRIDDNGNRVVYFIKDDTVCIIACKGHYE